MHDHHYHYVLYLMLAERSKTIGSVVIVKLVKLKKEKNVQIRIKKQIDASINAMELTRVSMSLKRAFAE